VKKQIADRLALNPHTVDYTMRCIYRKLHVNCQAAAVSRAVKDGLFR
jgi:DNA-binding NarL/FixJ family response regulator